jgi:two-component system cell cycle response regulator CtrA
MRALLIEDDATTSAKIAVMLENEGIVCDVADLGEDGLQQAKLYDYDIIILDLLLPDMDGYVVAVAGGAGAHPGPDPLRARYPQ